MYEIKQTMPFCKQVVDQIQTFPDNKKDILDALHNAEKMGRIPLALSVNSLGWVSVSPEEKGSKTVEEVLDLIERPDVDSYVIG